MQQRGRQFTQISIDKRTVVVLHTVVVLIVHTMSLEMRHVPCPYAVLDTRTCYGITIGHHPLLVC